VKAASTLGTFLRSFRWGHVRQLDAVSRHLLARAWAAGAGPGGAPLHRRAGLSPAPPRCRRRDRRRAHGQAARRQRETGRRREPSCVGSTTCSRRRSQVRVRNVTTRR
jgi:hypothetical protein